VYTDLPLDQLREYRSAAVEPADFDAFWADTMRITRAEPLDPVFEPYDARLRTVDTFDVTFGGFAGQRVRAWLQLPRGVPRPMPCVVEYLGYARGRALPNDALLYSAAGYAHLLMDTRGQGGVLYPGDTPDVGGSGASQSFGFLTRGVADPADFYYRRLFADAARAVEAARAHPAVDPARLAVAGWSQGGVMAMAAGALAADVAAVLPDSPFLCDIRRAVLIAPGPPYTEVTEYCGAHRDQVDTVLRTLDYVDGVHFAARCTAPALFSVALMDQACPPSTGYAAFNAYGGERKQMREWAFNGHEGGMMFQAAERLAFLDELLRE
jgi:cephalosporin-C deacetylase